MRYSLQETFAILEKLHMYEIICLRARFLDSIFYMAKAYKAVYILSPATIVSGKNKTVPNCLLSFI